MVRFLCVWNFQWCTAVCFFCFATFPHPSWSEEHLLSGNIFSYLYDLKYPEIQDDHGLDAKPTTGNNSNQFKMCWYSLENQSLTLWYLLDSVHPNIQTDSTGGAIVLSRRLLVFPDTASQTGGSWRVPTHCQLPCPGQLEPQYCPAEQFTDNMPVYFSTGWHKTEITELNSI